VRYLDALLARALAINEAISPWPQPMIDRIDQLRRHRRRSTLSQSRSSIGTRSGAL
jgi:hypothetical protein